MVDKTNEREEYGLACGGFDDRGFTYTSSVEIDVGTFFRRLFLDVEV